MNYKKLTAALLLGAMCAGLFGCAKETEIFSDDPETARREMYEKTSSEIIAAAQENPFTPDVTSEMPYHFTPDRELIAAEDFSFDENGTPTYVGSQYDAVYGIDVSDHQGDIDWQAVYDSGVRFAMIRVGYRGYSKGSLYADERFAEYVEGARAVGIKVGSYFFSQAISVAEAKEEASIVLKLLDGLELDYPFGYDWERIVGDKARTDNVNFRTATDCAKAFYDILTEAGYECSLYCIGPSEKCMFYLSELPGYQYWFFLDGAIPAAAYGDFMWQYTTKGSCPGISGECDLDILLTEKQFLKLG